MKPFKKMLVKMEALTMASMLLAAAPTCAYAQEGQTPAAYQIEAAGSTRTSIRYYVVVNNLKVRSGPGTSYEVITTLKKGDEVNLLSLSGSWVKISRKGQIGYVPASGIEL